MLEIFKITEINEFNKLKTYWNDVLSNSKENSFFLTWEHVAVSVKNLNDNQKLYILYIKNDDKIIAIAPLRKSKYSFRRGLSYNIIEPLDYGTSTDYNGLILTEQKSKTLLFFLSYLYRQKDWDFIKFSDIPKKSIFANLLIKFKNFFPVFELTKGAICPYLELPDSIEDFLKRYSKNFRKNLRRRLRALQRDHGKVEIKNYHEFCSIEEGMNLFFDLHQKRWLSINKPGAFNVQKVRDIFLDRAKFFDKKGWFALYFLVVNGKPIAAKYVIEYDKKIHGCLSGFEPRYSSYGIGNLLLMKVIETGITRKFSEYDFMKGDELYKFNWTKKYRTNINVKFINNNFRSRLINLCMETEKIFQNGLIIRY